MRLKSKLALVDFAVKILGGCYWTRNYRRHESSSVIEVNMPKPFQSFSLQLKWLTLEQWSFALCRSTYMWIFKYKHSTVNVFSLLFS